MCEEKQGCAVLNDCKYGVNVLGNSINLTLLRASMVPDMHADRGMQQFTYSFYSWNRCFAESGLVNQGYDLNVPVSIAKGASGIHSLFSLDKNNIFIEAVKPDVSIGTTKISLNSYFLEEKLSKLGFDEERVDTFRKFPYICNEFSKNLIEFELDFFEKYGLSELVMFYEELLRSITADDGFLLRLGFGIGWISTTVGLILEDNPRLLRDIRREFRLGRRRNQPEYVPEFPKTRKIIIEKGRPTYPMGWIRLKEI